ncbi:threonylcarbamoyl-AMP synthase [Patescibacteria group bacterium]|nr:threonylcarbamoyl-AMP synthase [Patescibacteria group bacterium]
MIGSEKEIEMLKNGAVGVMPTDTIYGLVASAFFRRAVERIYELKSRDYDKPFIILLSSIDDLKRFEIEIEDSIKNKLMEFWPGPVSVVLPCHSLEYKYLHRGGGALAFRVPADKDLRDFISGTGPLVAPSANPQGGAPAENIEDVKKYFGASVDFYIDGGELKGDPSTLIKFGEDGIEILRQGDYRIK